MVAPCGGPPELGSIYDTATNGWMWMTIQLFGVLPFAAGVVLGVPLVARELEHGTALLAWPLARSRIRWLATRILPVALMGVAILVVPAMAGELIIRAHFPVIDPATNFEGYGVRGPLLLLRFVLVLGLAALVGAWLRRQLPALLVAGALAAGLGVGLMQLQPRWVEPTEQPQVRRPIDHVGTLHVAIRYRDTDGTWMPDEEAWARMASVGEGEETDASVLPQEVFFSIPRDRYLDVVLRESAALVVASLAVAGFLGMVVSRRRPG